ncbi:unnamed protein product [Orchesella dallaii]|uniref:C2H2-type domain-containing protein n=1 Tax=Orchesella dallaii TaxID=48710 RepID=A0ABP1SAC5_9HEXA
MKLSVCLVCLKTFDRHFLLSEEDGVSSSVPLLTRFIKFAENYLNLSSVTTQQLLLSGSDRKEAFCEKCELSVINPICQVYLDLLSAQLRLSIELEQLGKLLDNSKVTGSDKLRVLNINALSNQLGVRSLSQLEGFRTSLAQKCLLKRKQSLPDVLLFPQFVEDETGRMGNANGLAREATDNNSFDVKLNTMNSFERQTGEAVESGRAPIEKTVIKLETFPQDSDPELIFEIENAEEIDYSPSEPSELAVIPVAERAGTRVNGKYYNGYHCPKCSKVLRNEKWYQHHYRYFHLAISCNYCGKTFGNLKLLRVHFKRLHQNQGIYTCQLCSKDFETAMKLKVHKRKEHLRYSCPHCEATFKLKYIMEEHVAKIHNPGSYTCPNCPEDSKVFTNSKYLATHIRQKHFLLDSVQTQVYKL